jgi:hypothetical protein
MLVMKIKMSTALQLALVQLGPDKKVTALQSVVVQAKILKGEAPLP